VRRYIDLFPHSFFLNTWFNLIMMYLFSLTGKNQNALLQQGKCLNYCDTDISFSESTRSYRLMKTLFLRLVLVSARSCILICKFVFLN
jgi:hypothetical protein